MSEYKKIKLGDIFTLEKGSLQSSKCTPGQYDFITAAEDWKTHESYTHDCEAIVYAVAASGSLGRAHYVNGKFIASDLCFIMQEKDKEKYPVNFQFYQIIFEVLRDEIVSKTKTGTSKESISQKNLSKYEIPYFDYDFQIANYERLVRTKQIIAKISKETESQKAYAKQLRQNILQDAIEGKLTAEWRKTHPVIKGNPDFDAEALFEEIQKEKKSDKKQKELAPISDDEKTFEIPDGWKWVRLGEVVDSVVYGTSEKCSYDENQNSKILRIPNLSSGYVNDEDLKYTNLSDDEKKELSLKENDLLVIRSNGSPEIVGKMVYVPKQFENYCYAGYLIRLRFSISQVGYFIGTISSASSLRNQIEEPLRSTVGINNINSDEIKALIFPLAPLSEQIEVVKQIENFLMKIAQLEQQITQREEYANQLMQSILKDIFNN